MKKILIALYLLPIMLYGQWQPIYIPGTTPSNDELAIGNVFFIATKDGVFRSTDNALHWQFAWPSIDYPYICQLDGELFAVNKNSGLAKSADLGLTWQSLADTTTVNAAAIAATDSFVYVGGSGKLHRYQRYGPGQPPVEVYSFANPNQAIRLGNVGHEIWMSGTSGLFRSADHGATWDTINLNWNIKGLGIHDETILVSITTNQLMRSTDAGTSWTSVTHNFQPGRIHWTDGAWFSTWDGYLRYSTDDGDSWTDISPILESWPGPGRAAKIGDNLVWSHVLAASHPYTLNIEESHVLNFFFENINLPDSLSDEPGSHGFVKFSLKPKQGLQLGDQVPNRAHIYFDFNSPIITNTVISEIVLPVLPHTVDTVFNTVEACIYTEVAGILVYSDTVIYVQHIGMNADTLFIYEVSILPNSETHISVLVCYGTGVSFGNETLTEPGTYTLVLQNQAGCDSIVTLELTVNPVSNTLSLIELCEHEASPLTGTVYDVAGQYTENLLLQNQYGCDSLIQAEVTVHPEEFLVADNGPLPYGTVYHDVVLTQDTQFIFYDTTQFGCLLTISENVTVFPSATTEGNSDGFYLGAYPNPSNGDFQASLLLDRPVQIKMTVFDAYGKQISPWGQAKNYDAGEHTLSIEATDWPPGIYMLVVQAAESYAAKRLVKW